MFFCVSHELLGVLIPCHISHIYIGLVVSYAGLKYELPDSGHCTGKSLSEALIFASTYPQYDDRLFIDLPVQYMKTTSSEHGENMLCT